MCGDPACRDSGKSDVGHEGKLEKPCGCCRESVASQADSSPVDHTPPMAPTQCLCQGALANVLGKLYEGNMAFLLPALNSILDENSHRLAGFERFEDTNGPSDSKTGRDVCLTVCALRL